MKTLYLILTTLLLASVSLAQTAVTWTSNGSSQNVTVASGASLTATVISTGSDLTGMGYNGSDFYGYDTWPTGAMDLNGGYMQFTITAKPGFYLSLSQINLTLRRSTTGTSAGSGPNNWSLRSSLDNYASDITTNTINLGYQTFNIALNNTATTPFMATTSVTFRLYGYNSVVTSGGDSRFVTSNINIVGQTNSGVLAAQSLALSAGVTGNAVNLQWQPEGFAEGTEYSVERSVDGSTFDAIASLSAVSYRDGTLPDAARVYYRVAAQQPDGSTFWSSTVAVNLSSATTEAAIRSVAAAGENVQTLLHIDASGSYQLNIWSTGGQLLYRQTIQEQAGDQASAIAFGAHPHGVYILTLSGTGVRMSREFIY